MTATSRIVRSALVVAGLVASFNAWASSDVASDRYFKHPSPKHAAITTSKEPAPKQNGGAATDTQVKRLTCSCPAKS